MENYNGCSLCKRILNMNVVCSVCQDEHLVDSYGNQLEPEFKIDNEGTKYWELNNKFHRLDGPAIEYASGNKHWFVNGKLHRLDGPAVEYANGSKYWYVNGKFHRLDGPAIENDGHKEYWIEGKEYSYENWKKKVKEYEKNKK